MDIARSVKKSVKIRELLLNSDDEVTIKIVKEVLMLFKIEIIDDHFLEKNIPIDYLSISIENHIMEEFEKVETVVRFTDTENRKEIFFKECFVNVGERVPAAYRRLIKLNLYTILLEFLNSKPAPWGILHGVRPTKIIHKYIDQQMHASMIIQRLQDDYAVSLEKAELITHLAFRQRNLLARSAPNKVSIYIGIPFCLSRCLYCSFPSYVLPDEKILQQFMSALKKDLWAAKQVIEENQLVVQNIYIGGGTPTSLPVPEFTELLTLAKDLFFQKETVEFTVEAGRPDSVNDEKIAVMMRSFVNRVSVNPQTMQEKTLKHIGRKHTTQSIIDLFEQFKQAGMPSINMDLIIGLPGENCADIEDTMRQIVLLRPDNITLHTLALKKGSALKMNRDVYVLPDDETVTNMFSIAMRYVSELGLEPYYLYRQGYMSGNLENIGFSKPGAEGLYNVQIMEERQTVIGIGPAATTKVVDTKNWSMQTSFNAKDLTTYLQCVDKYIKRRTNLLNQAFRHREESFLC